jgi:hypothetical protein
MKKTITMTSIIIILAVILSACNLSPAQPTQMSADAINTVAAQTVQALTTQMAPPPATATATLPAATATATQAPTLNTTSLPTMSTTGIATLGSATLAPIATVASSSSLSLFTTGTHNCNQAYFIADANYPDGSKVAPGESFTKKWTLGNDGTCNWTTAYQVTYESGNENYDSDLTGESDANISQLVVPGGTTTVGINLVAPKKTGTYTYYFKLLAADGTKFGIGVAGSTFTLVIKVTTGSTNATEAASTTISGTISAGGCDGATPFTGSISTNDNATVTYRWRVYSTGGDVVDQSGKNTLTFDSSGTQNTVNYSPTLTNGSKYTIALYASETDPSGLTGDITSTSYTCSK